MESIDQDASPHNSFVLRQPTYYWQIKHHGLSDLSNCPGVPYRVVVAESLCHNFSEPINPNISDDLELRTTLEPSQAEITDPQYSYLYSHPLN